MDCTICASEVSRREACLPSGGVLSASDPCEHRARSDPYRSCWSLPICGRRAGIPALACTYVQLGGGPDSEARRSLIPTRVGHRLHRNRIRKTYLACALGRRACRPGISASYHRVSRLPDRLALARADGSYPKPHDLARDPAFGDAILAKVLNNAHRVTLEDAAP